MLIKRKNSINYRYICTCWAAKNIRSKVLGWSNLLMFFLKIVSFIQ